MLSYRLLARSSWHPYEWPEAARLARCRAAKVVSPKDSSRSGFASGTVLHAPKQPLVPSNLSSADALIRAIMLYFTGTPGMC